MNLPLIAAGARRAPEEDAGPGGSAGGAPGRRIVVADDNEDAAASLAMMLQLLGHETRTASDGVEALEAAEAFAPDVMLVDIGMPRLNGYDVARRIRERPGGAEVLLIALTGWGQDSDRLRSRDAGFDAHLVKPVELDRLQRLITDAVRPRGGSGA